MSIVCVGSSTYRKYLSHKLKNDILHNEYHTQYNTYNEGWETVDLSHPQTHIDKNMFKYKLMSSHYSWSKPNLSLYSCLYLSVHADTQYRSTILVSGLWAAQIRLYLFYKMQTLASLLTETWIKHSVSWAWYRYTANIENYACELMQINNQKSCRSVMSF